MEKEQISERKYTILGNQGVHRCACGNANDFLVWERTFDDDSTEYQISCEQCCREASAAKKLLDAIRAFNDINNGAIPLRFRIESAPDVITIYSKSEDDVEELLQKEFSRQVRVRRFTEEDFNVLLHKQLIVNSSDIVINNYAFTRKGETVKVIDLNTIARWSLDGAYMEMQMDGTILHFTANMYNKEIPQELWRKLHRLDIVLPEE
ncbi:MAG: hypothetical protein J6B01_09465 [Ruminococcus sp.]|nr:hypothetical protein [Ruminococcus sp.]